jgi:hypothetical protein
MAIDARTRMSLYTKLLPILGDEDTNALMSTYPAFEAEEYVSKEFLRAELATLENRVTVRLGTAIAASTSIMLAAVALLR